MRKKFLKIWDFVKKNLKKLKIVRKNNFKN